MRKPEVLHDWSSIRMYLPANFAFGRIYAGNRNPADVIASGLTRLYRRYDAPRARRGTLPHFLISGTSHISRWRRQSADLVLVVAVSALIFVTFSDIVFDRRGGFLRRAIGGGDSISTPSVVLLLFPDANRKNFFPIDSFHFATRAFYANNLLTSSRVLTHHEVSIIKFA